MARREDVEILERRLRQMEAKNQALTRRLSKVQHSHDSNTVATINLDEEDTLEEQVDFDDTGGDKTQDENEVAKQVVSLSMHAGAQKQYLGSASGAILANLFGFKDRPDYAEGDNDEIFFRRFGTTHAQSQGSLRREVDRDKLLPEPLARSLMVAYLLHDHLCYPYLHPRKLTASLTLMYSEEDYYHTHPVEAFTMDMIFAIETVHVHKFSWQVIPDAETHYDRAITKFGHALEAGGLVALQSIMLLCQYRMLSVSYSTSASLWHMLGMAARLCLELGLHREDSYVVPSHVSPGVQSAIKEDLDIKRRCFWSLFGMDRVVSTTLGRPMAINLDDVDTEFPEIEQRLEPMSSMSPSANEILQNPRWPANTAIFIQITRHRIMIGKTLSRLHNIPKSRMPDPQTRATIRQQIAEELDEWRARIPSLPLTEAGTGKAQNMTNFRSPEWYNLLYHNTVLMVYRPTHAVHDNALTDATLRQLYDSARQSIASYSYLHKSRKINYTWITLHAVFLVGLSYVYALRSHFQSRRRQSRSVGAPEPLTAFGAQLPVDPSIPEILNDTRACATVLVAISERWNTARGCNEVFGKLCDAVVTEAVEFHTNSGPNGRLNAPAVAANPAAYNDLSYYPPVTGDQAPLPFSMDIDHSYQDCFDELQELFGPQFGNSALLPGPDDWLFEALPRHEEF